MKRKRFRILNVVDDVTHACLVSIPDIPNNHPK
jgi:hypothetical protein